MDLAIHFPNFTLPGEPETLASVLSDTAGAAEAGGCSTFTLMDHWFQMEQLAQVAGPDAGGLHLAGVSGRSDATHHPRPSGHRSHLPPSRAAGQDGDHARCPVGRPCSTGHRCGLVRAGAPGPRRAVPADQSSDSNAWRRRSRSAGRCGATTTVPTRGVTTSWPRPSARPAPSADRRPGSSSAAAESGRPSGWWRGTPTPATSSLRTRRWWPTSSTCWTATVTPRDVTRPPSSGPSSSDPIRSTTWTPSCPPWPSTRSLGIGQVWVSPSGPEPARWVERVSERAVPELAEL